MPFYDDDQNEIDPATKLIPKLSLSREKKDDPFEENLCNLNRLDNKSDKDFKFGVYESIYGVLEDETVVE